ncbi:hypothetical protein [Hymenobacter negativus]|uniref:Uncharacterized protein n=1 Tax=Hymenobacter negativus TaxID=2795026 RepID=A0ABS3Q9U8_9BACT|nr:hypothetical protein [Hymenobacter negativus]MBO2007911.1 hypothetical protein [Hymenobacter negativus]
MSVVTTVLLIFPGSEHEPARIREVNAFESPGQTVNLVSVEAPNAALSEFHCWYGGTKSALGHLYLGSFNHFDLDGFRRHLSQQVQWEDPEHVQVLIRRENEWAYSLYTHAGAQLVYQAPTQ